jgi:hypothetical protein
MRRPLRDRPDGPEEERLFDLMRERAVAGLGDDELRELNRLAALHPDVDLECYDRAAATIDLAFARRPFEALPLDLARKVAASAPPAAGARGALAGQPAGSGTTVRPGAPRAEIAVSGPASAARPTAGAGSSAARPASGPAARAADPRSPSQRAWFAWGGWVAAAAATVVAILGWMRVPGPVDPLAASLALQAEVDAAPDHLVLPWKPTEDPDGRNVSGELHWSTALQKGYMRFRGLPANDPAQKQYQLWIFDKPRGSEHPVDGGVFDVVANEVVVPIDAKIRVAEPELFAVTAESPGGVVVSKREHIVSLAQF